MLTLFVALFADQVDCNVRGPLLATWPKQACDNASTHWANMLGPSGLHGSGWPVLPVLAAAVVVPVLPVTVASVLPPLSWSGLGWRFCSACTVACEALGRGRPFVSAALLLVLDACTPRRTNHILCHAVDASSHGDASKGLIVGNPTTAASHLRWAGGCCGRTGAGGGGAARCRRRPPAPRAPSPAAAAPSSASQSPRTACRDTPRSCTARSKQHLSTSAAPKRAADPK